LFFVFSCPILQKNPWICIGVLMTRTTWKGEMSQNS
jgi:hypothetical protein